MLVVGVEHGNGLLHNDGAVIEFLIDKMDRTTGNLHAIGEGLFLRFQSGETRQQRWMNIQNAMRELLYEPGREKAHVASEADEINFVLDQRGHNIAVVLLAWPAFRRDYQGVESAPASGVEARSIGTIRNHDSNSGVRYPPRRDAIGNGHKVRP